MKLLINRVDIAEYRNLSSTVLDKVLNPHILDAQFNDIQKLIGSDFFNDLVLNSANANYQTLLNGGSYTYNSVTYTNVGLKVVLVHYAYSRYSRFGSNTDTPFGLVVKSSENTTQISDTDKKASYTENRSLAFNYWENVKKFLDRNATDYPLYEDGCMPVYSGLKIKTIR